MNKLLKLSKRGDTIIEVLLAIVVVSGTLGTAFATMDRGTQGTRASQERAEALKLVEGQIELLKEAREQGVVVHGLGPNAFCMRLNGTSVETTSSHSPPQAPGDLNSDNFGNYSADCSIPIITGGYNLSIEESAGLFTVRARWTNVRGDVRDQVEIRYRIPTP